MKINVDAHVVEGVMVGLGVVIRNHEGNLIVAGTKRLTILLSQCFTFYVVSHVKRAENTVAYLVAKGIAELVLYGTMDLFPQKYDNFGGT